MRKLLVLFVLEFKETRTISWVRMAVCRREWQGFGKEVVAWMYFTVAAAAAAAA